MMFPERIAQTDKSYDDNLEYYELYLKEFYDYRVDIYHQLASNFTKGSILEIDPSFGEVGFSIIEINPKLVLYCFETRCAYEDVLTNKIKELDGKAEVTIAHGNINRLPYDNDYFQGVINTNSLRKWSDPSKAINEIIRVTKKGGKVFINDLKRNADENVIEIILQDWKSRKNDAATWFIERFIDGWKTSYTTEELEDIIENSGLRYEILHDGPVTHTAYITK